MKRRAAALVLVLTGASSALADGGRSPSASAAAPSVPGASAPCASCHADIAREWVSSAHRRSASDLAYVDALAREPMPFCRACHAPSADPNRPTPQAVQDEGIGCSDCHAKAHARAASSLAAPTRTCASCHEFKFPVGQAWMQKTATEHAASAFATKSCVSCHMEMATDGGRPHRDHRFDVSPLLARALNADVARASATRVAFRLRPGDVGHALPTGDLFRRLAIRVDPIVTGASSKATATRFLSRRFSSTTLPNGQRAMVEVRDDRVGGANLAPCFEIDVGVLGEGVPLDVEIAIEHVDHPSAGRDADAAVSAHLPVFRSVVANGDAPRPCR